MVETTIEILRYARENNGFTIDNLIAHLNNKGLNFELNRQINRDTTLMKNIIQCYFTNHKGEDKKVNFEDHLFLKAEALSFLLNFETTEKAKEDSKKAINFATYSLWIAIFSMLLSTIFSIISLCKS